MQAMRNHFHFCLEKRDLNRCLSSEVYNHHATSRLAGLLTATPADAVQFYLHRHLLE